jgi:putative pyruvate formate lyase activating enzyme
MGVGKDISIEELALGMLGLQKKGAHNINLVTSTHQMPALVNALVLAVQKGLKIPLVYNSGGYESIETLKLLEKIIDIYLPDIKYSDSRSAAKYSGAPDYVERNREALLEMWTQVGPLLCDTSGIAVKGMMVRHLVLPQNLAGSSQSFSFLREHMGPQVWVSLMNQYFPARKGPSTPPLDRKTTEQEYEAAFDALTQLGLLNGFAQQC